MHVEGRPDAKFGQPSINFPHIVDIQAQKCILILRKYLSAHHLHWRLVHQHHPKAIYSALTEQLR